MPRPDCVKATPALAALALLLGCASDSPTSTPPSGGGGAAPPFTIQALTGGSQSGVVGSVLAETLVVKVADARGDPVEGAVVGWSVAAGGGSLTPGSRATDAQGRAQAKWTLGTSAGEQKVSAKVGNLSAEFTATAKPDRPAKLSLSPDSVVVGVDPGLDTASVLATVVDRHGNPISDVSIQWSSSDTTIARIDAQGSVQGRRPGRVVLTAMADTLRGEGAARVKLQMNAQCRVPSTFPTRGVVAGSPRFVEEFRLDSLRATHGDVQGTILDLGNDGHPDVLVFSNNRSPDGLEGFRNAIQVWRNDGSGHFSDATASVLGTDTVPVDGPPSSRVVDLNGDGLQDVFAAQAGWDYPPGPGGPDLLLVQQAGGKLTDIAPRALHPYESRGNGAFTHSGAAADIDCDGDIDLYQGNINHPVGPHLQVNRGGGTFQAEERQRLPEFVWRLEDKFTASEFCDVDRDGDSDLALGGFDGSRDRLLINNGYGRFAAAAEDALPLSVFSRNVTVEIRCADVDLDGWNDLVVSSNDNYVQPRISYWRNTHDRTFEDLTSTHLPQEWPSLSPGTVWVDELQVADLNGDGWPDLVGSGICVGTIFVNMGSGRFAQQSNVLPTRNLCDRAGQSNHLLLPLDADRDGRNDLLLLRGAEHHTLETTRGRFQIGVSSILLQR